MQYTVFPVKRNLHGLAFSELREAVRGEQLEPILPDVKPLPLAATATGRVCYYARLVCCRAACRHTRRKWLYAGALRF